jgi:hypothetical protein
MLLNRNDPVVSGMRPALAAKPSKGRGRHRAAS